MFSGNTVLPQLPDSEIDETCIYGRCHCGNCIIMAKPIECNCCCQLDDGHTKIRNKIKQLNERESTENICITQFEAFATVCLNPDVLELAYYTYRQEHGRLHVHIHK